MEITTKNIQNSTKYGSKEVSQRKRGERMRECGRERERGKGRGNIYLSER